MIHLSQSAWRNLAAAVAGCLALFALPVESAAPERHVYVITACIDGVDDLHVKGDQLWWEHLAFTPPGLHQGCPGVLSVDGQAWGYWQSKFQLPGSTANKTITFDPEQCRGNCYVRQKANAQNGWETIYRFDDYSLLGSAVYVVNLIVGDPGKPASNEDVHHSRPFESDQSQNNTQI